jgi:hypothetical protein
MVLGLHSGEYTQGPAADGGYEMLPVITPITVGAGGVVQAGLPALLPGEFFTLSGLGGMHQVRVSMEEFPGHANYDVHNHWLRQREAINSVPVNRMYSETVVLNRDYLEVVFESYQGALDIPFTGLQLGSSALAMATLVVTASGGALFSTRRLLRHSVP